MNPLIKNNETYTKTLLQKIVDYKNANNESKISFDSIYDILGCEPEVSGTYSVALNSYINNYIISKTDLSQLYPQNDLTDYTVYKRGDYFHRVINSEVSANERIIININMQENALKIFKKLFNNQSIYGMKIFLIDSTAKIKFKYDKIVIYYNKKDFEEIYEEIMKSGVDSSFFKKQLSAFYDIYNEDGYYIGVGKEVNNTSFTTETAKKVFEKVTGKDYIEEIERIEYPILSNISKDDLWAAGLTYATRQT